MAKRGPREGSIRRRPDGLWEARYRAANGRRQSIYSRTRAEVQERLRAALTAADNGVNPFDQRAKVGEWLDGWMTTFVEPRLRPRTTESYEMVCRLYLKPTLGRIVLAQLQPEHVARMLRDLDRRGLSKSTSRYALTILRIALGRAVRSGRLPRNVALLVDAPRPTRVPVRPLTAQQARLFLAGIRNHRLEPLFALAISTGMRQGELLGLRWQDIDFETGQVAVRHTLQLRTRDLADPKTESSRRTLQLGGESLALLRDLRRGQVEVRFAAGSRWIDLDLVFTGPSGKPLQAANVTREFQMALSHLGLPRQRFHDLRHAFATLLIEDGVDLAVVSKYLGHSSISTTVDTYGHLTAEMTRGIADRMAEILGPNAVSTAKSRAQG